MTTQANFPDIRPSLLLDFANSGQVDPRVTFTRASTATYYDIDTVAKAEENFFLYSQQFENAYWTKTNASITADAVTAPDGTATADTLTADAGTSLKRIRRANIPSPGVLNTFSIFVKAGTHGIVQLTTTGSSTYYANFDVTTGVLGSVGGGATATIVAAGNSWYRCTATFSNQSSSSDMSLCFIASTTDGYAPTSTTTATGTVHLWGAQYEDRSAATAYTATTTQAITNYVPQLMTAPAGRPRIDYNPITRAPLGLLIEESRQNVWLRSEDFANASWTKTASSITANTIVAPDGTLTGDKIVEDTANSSHYVSQAITSVVSTTYVTSVYLKAGERSAVRLSRNGGTVASAFDLSAGTVTNAAGSTGTITAVGNGWYRCSISFAGASVTDSVYIELQTSASTSSQTYTGNGYAGVYVWGAQWETGSFATSYIPTVASAVTRSADAASMTGTNFSSWYNAAEGTLYAEYRVTAATVRNAAAISDNTLNNRIILRANNASGSGNAVSIGSVGGAVQWNDSAGTPSLTQLNKFTVAYRRNDVAFALNAGAVVTDTSCLIPVVDRLNIGSDGSAGTDPLNGHLGKLAYYPLRVTNAQLQAITG